MDKSYLTKEFHYNKFIKLENTGRLRHESIAHLRNVK